MTILSDIQRQGQQIWLDNLSRTLLREGQLQRLIDAGLCGLTSNPAIFNKAFASSPYYQPDVARLKQSALTPVQRFEALAVPDIQAACDLFAPLHQASNGDAGWVSLEVDPTLAHDVTGTVAAARRLKAAVDRPNVYIKVPATPAGVQAIETLIGEGVSINVTLMFSPAHYEAVAQAYLRGIRTWIGKGGDPRAVSSVASVFLSRVDTLVDKRLDALGTPEASALRGRTADALARLCYQRYRELFEGAAFAELAARGVRPQKCLWASTGLKDKSYGDELKYVTGLIGPDTVNTLPDATLDALMKAWPITVDNHLAKHVDAARSVRVGLAALGIDLDAVGETLQADGVKLFDAAFSELLAQIS